MNIVTGEQYNIYTGNNENVKIVKLKRKPSKLTDSDDLIFIYNQKN